jgi:P-type Ca2+ transporter type 2C
LNGVGSGFDEPLFLPLTINPGKLPMKTSVGNTYPIEHPQTIPTDEIIRIFQTNPREGLKEDDVKKRVEAYGLNTYKAQEQKSIFLIVLEQFKSPIILLLVVAGVFSFVFQHWLEGFSIIGVILVTAALGFFMELQARQSMNALREMDVSVSKVWRESALREIPSEELVPGDILVLEAGDITPADGRLLEINQFEVDESALT